MKNLPNMDTRRIRRTDDGAFTVESVATLNRSGTICDHCARRSCRYRGYMKRAKFVRLEAMSCNLFLPALGFSVLKGLDLETWNTFRLGGAWAKRLSPGEDVAVIDTKNNRFVGMARVESVYLGDLDTLLAQHASANHAIIHEYTHEGLRLEDAGDRLMRILKNAYGSTYTHGERTATVIYLRKI